MSYPFILWFEQRTGSNTLFNALCRLSEHKSAAGEPFDPERGIRRDAPQFGDVCLLNDKSRDRVLWDICQKRWLIRHCYERLPLEFNIALANTAKHNGYRQIHLSRRDEVARLASKGIAEQLGTWEPSDSTRRTYADIQYGRRRIKPLNVAELLKWKHIADEQWRAIRGQDDFHEVRSEDLFAGPRDDRVRAFMHVSDHIHVQTEVERDLLKGNQQTLELCSLVPNLAALRDALKH